MTLISGANQPLGGQRIIIELSAHSLGGVRLLAEDGGAVRVLPTSEVWAPVSVTGQQARVDLDLTAVPPTIARLRLLSWSESRTRLLVPLDARVSVDGALRFAVPVEESSGMLRAAEILEVYRRHGSWKVRAVASGWEDHVPAMARGVGVPETAFAETRRPPTSRGSRQAAPAQAVHRGPSPQVGPPLLRDLLDSVVGPGPRTGDRAFLDFALHGAELRLGLKEFDGFVQVVAIAPLGSGQLTDATAEAALRITGRAPLARVTIDEAGDAVAAAVAYAATQNLDSALIKALLSEVWVAAHCFAQLVRPLGWPITERFTAEVPREVRLGIAEELQDTAVWRDVRERLMANDCLPLVDEPSVMLALTDGQLWIGPSLLAGTNRAWGIIVERILRSDVTPRNGLWRALALRNSTLGPVRFGVINEVGLHGPLAITANFAALQLPRTQILEDLQHGLNFVDEAAADLDGLLRSMAPDSSTTRNNLPWIPERRWTGPGTEVREQVLVRELTSVPAGAGIPMGFLDRVRSQQATVGRPGVGYLGHLALLRAESRGPAAPAWLHLARELIAMTPITAPGDPCAAASIHVRLGRLSNPVAPRRVASPAPPASTAPPPSSPSSDPRPAQSGTTETQRRKRWRLFD
ncbi:MAG: hypothetical protein WKF96_02670 [Solirubrobacteraceae bacterium]